MYNPYAFSKSVYLRTPTLKDVEGSWHEWFSDEEITMHLGDRFLPNSLEKQKEFYDSIINSTNRLVFSIVEIATDKHIGVCNLSAINWKSRFCDISFIIGEKDYLKKGIGTEVVGMLIDIAFSRLNLINIKASYLKNNISSEKVLKKFGFEVVGIYKKLTWFKDRYEDAIFVHLSRENWVNNKKS